ncbi:uncharacterized protein [Rutidosis leptorrhynchoides]|uniref:uncharacterized protein n=1 Tax=Rutidosis leptorrhynchoides TaxID=125765 RepID=UPI003A99B1D8
MGESLKTQDKLRGWELQSLTGPLLCSLCSLEPDSHDHLFFNCVYSTQVWFFVKSNMTSNINSNSWKDFIEFASEFADKKSARSITSKLLFAASVYFIWQERNFRLFKKQSRSCANLVAVIYSTVRLKLLSLRWKPTKHAKLMKESWKIP